MTEFHSPNFAFLADLDPPLMHQAALAEYQRGYDDEGEEEFFPTKKGFRFPERELKRVVKEYALMPETYVHPLIVRKSFSLLNDGQFESAVLQAFKTIETRIRWKIKATPDFFGVKLIRKAFNPENGPLRNNFDLLIRHHIAKILYWKGDQESAAKEFSDLLTEYPESQHSRLQITRIFSNQKKHDEVDDQINIVLGSSKKLVSHSILLSFYDLLSDSNYQDARKKFIDDRIVDFFVDFSSTLYSSFDHPYRVISKLSGHLGYNHPKEFSAFCSNLPAPDNIQNNAMVMQAYATIQMALYRVYKYSTLDDKDKLMESSATIAEKYYLEAGADSDFQKNTLAKFYLEIGNYDKASNTLEFLTSKEDAFYYQTLSKIQRFKNDFGAAINSIDKAIDIEKNRDNRKWFLSSFLNDKAETLFLQNDPTSISVLEEALEIQTNKKTKDAWLNKIQKWKSEFNC
jgi:hypothetical protein